MIDLLAQLTVAELTAWVVVVALNAYVLFGGADFGGGVWDLLASGPRHDRQRSLIVSAMGPIWEANHVWLIVVVVVLFVCFPLAFASFATVLHIPLSLLLIGIVLRGSAFVFRSYSYGGDIEQRRWGLVFAGSSLVTPVVLGMCVGAVVSGEVGAAVAHLSPLAPGAPAATPPTPAAFTDIYVSPWLSPFCIAVGLLTLALFSLLAATYLTVEAADDRELQEDFRRHALGAAIASIVIAIIALMLDVLREGVMSQLVGVGWSIPLFAGAAVAAAGVVIALLRRRYELARAAAGALVTLILWGWALAQFPLMIPPGLTINEAAASDRVLEATIGVLAGGAVVLVPSLWYLLRVFKRRERTATSSP